MTANTVLSFKSTLRDILRAAPVNMPFLAHLVISELEKEVQKDELPFVYLYLRDTLWLITQELYDLAAVSMIIIIENSMREKLLSISTYKGGKNVEELNLSELNRALKDKISDKCWKTVDDINKLRIIILHSNMALGETKLDNKKVIDFLKREKLPAHIRHQIVRSYLETRRQFMLDDSIKMFKECLMILRELKPNDAKFGDSLDNFINFDIALRNNSEDLAANVKALTR